MTRLTKLGDVTEIVAGVGFPKDMQGREATEVPVFKVGDISIAWTRGERFLRTSRNYLTFSDASRLGRLVPAGATVFAKIGEALRLNRRAVLAQPSLVDNNVMGVVPHIEVVVPLYLFYFMQTVDLGKLSRATAVPSIRKLDVVDISIPLPPIPKQELIVAELEKQFSRLDEAVANLKRVKANLRRYKAAVLNAAVEGRLVPTEADLARREGRGFEAGHELLQSIVDARCRNWNGKGHYKEPAAPVLGVVPSVPDGWAVSSLEAITSASRVICYGILMPKENVANGVLYVKVRNMRADAIDLPTLERTSHQIAAKYARASLRTGDILLSIRGTYGRVATVPPELNGGNITQDTARLEVSSLFMPEFVAAYLRSEYAQRYFKRVARGVAVKGVNIGDIRPMAIPIPPVAEQRRIVDEIERRLSIAREVEVEADANLKRAQGLRQATLRRTFAATTEAGQ